MAGPVAVHLGKDAVLLRQRPEAVLSRLLLGQARQHFRLPDGDRGGELSRRPSSGSPAWRAFPCRAQTPPRRPKRRSACASSTCSAWRRACSKPICKAAAGAKARGYLADRGLGPDVQQRFSARLRFARANSRCATRWPPRGVTVEAMIEAGLLVHGEDIAVPYDRFRDRVMFPIHDRSGRVIAFGGRAMEAGAKAKYLNSPETALFHKGSLLFNHHRARKSAHDQGSIDRGRGLYRRDRDERGGLSQCRRAARHRAHPRSMRPPLGNGERADPVLRRRQRRAAGGVPRHRDGAAADRPGQDACGLRFCLRDRIRTISIRSSGPSAMAERLADARPLADMLFLRETDGQSLDTPESRAALERRLGESVAQDRRRDAAPPLRGGYEAARFRRSSARTRRGLRPRRRRATRPSASGAAGRSRRAGPALALRKPPLRAADASSARKAPFCRRAKS